MRLSVKGLTIAGAIFGGGMLFLIGIADLIFGGYGVAMLQVADSVYPGYTYGGGFWSVIVGTLYAALDGAVAGALFGWLYNLFVPRA